MSAEDCPRLRPVELEADAQVVEILEDCLADAKAGEVTALGMVMMIRGNHSRMIVSTSAFDNPFAMMGAMHHCADLISNALADAEAAD